MAHRSRPRRAPSTPHRRSERACPRLPPRHLSGSPQRCLGQRAKREAKRLPTRPAEAPHLTARAGRDDALGREPMHRHEGLTIQPTPTTHLAMRTRVVGAQRGRIEVRVAVVGGAARDERGEQRELKRALGVHRRSVSHGSAANGDPLTRSQARSSSAERAFRSEARWPQRVRPRVTHHRQRCRARPSVPPSAPAPRASAPPGR